MRNLEGRDVLYTAAEALDSGEIPTVFDAVHLADAFRRDESRHTVDGKLLRTSFTTKHFRPKPLGMLSAESGASSLGSTVPGPQEGSFKGPARRAGTDADGATNRPSHGRLLRFREGYRVAPRGTRTPGLRHES